MKRTLLLLLAAAVLGIWLSWVYINPYGGQILLSQLVLQLSGARGEFPLSPYLSGLLEFTLRLVPAFLFQAFVGIRLYQHYCTASVYVFSRIPNRIRWYAGQTAVIGLQALAYQLLLMLAALVTALLRWQVVWDAAGFLLFALHTLLYTLWLIMTAVLVNLLAIFQGSSAAFAWVTGGQLALLAPLSLLPLLDDTPLTQSLLVCLNPICRLILSWHTGQTQLLAPALAAPYRGLYPIHSVVLLLVLCAAVLAVGAQIIRRHDLIVSDMESGGK